MLAIMLTVILPDESRREFDWRGQRLRRRRAIGPGLAKSAVVAEVDGALATCTRLCPRGRSRCGCSPSAIPKPCRHAARAAHVMAQAVMRLDPGVSWPSARRPRTAFTTTSISRSRSAKRTFPAIEAEMAQDRQGRRTVRAARRAAERRAGPLRRAGPDVQGRAHRDGPGRPRDAVVLSPGRVHRSLPRAAHSQHRRTSAAFKLLSVAGAYWKGDASRSSCSGSTAPRSSARKSSTSYLEAVEEAKRRDHRVLGKQLELFTISPLVGSGLILWLPKGAIIRGLLEDFVRKTS